MLIEITYNVTDVFMSTTETPVYVEISFEQPGGSAAVWGSITGTLSNQTDLQNALNLKVPYTGATTNVNLGEYELKAGQVTLDTSPTGTAAVGTIRWNDTTGTSETTLKGGNVILKNGVDLVARVVNKVSPNTTLTKAAYQAVRVSGAQGQRLAVAFAQANNDANSADTIGIVIETIPTNQEGFIMTVGQLEGINTTGSLQGETWVDGDVLYLSPTTAGAVTNVKPTAVTGHIVVIGYVEYAHQNNGKIYVKVMNGWELDELHNVSIVTPTNNQGLFYNSSNSLWENKTISTALGYTPVPTTRNITINGVTYDLSADRTYTISTGISGSGAAGQVTYWTGASAVSGSNNLFWDNGNGRLGIGTNVPAYKLDVSGDARINNTTQFIFDTTRLQISTTGVSGFYGNNFINWSSSTNYTLQRQGGTVGIRINSTDNVSIGATTDGGQKFQVYGDTLLRGSGATSATTALTVQNSSSVNILRVLNDGQTILRGTTNNDTTNIFRIEQQNGNGRFLVNANGQTIIAGDAFASSETFVTVSRGNFNPTSGTATHTSLAITPTINQTGGANGITRGLYVNPTLTAAADFRAIETTAGNVLFGSNFFWDNTNGRLGIGTNVPAVRTHIVYSDNSFLNGLYVQNTNTGANAYSGIGLQDSAGNVLAGFQYVPNTFSAVQLRNSVLFASTGQSKLAFVANSGVVGGVAQDIYFATLGNKTNLYLYGNTGNLVLQNGGTFTDNGQRLQVYGDTLLRGSGNTSATTALTVQNSSSTNLFTVRNDGLSTFGGDISINTSSSSPSIQIQSNTSSTVFDGNAQGSGTVAFELRNLGVRRFRILCTATNTTFESSNQTGSFTFNNLVSLPASTTSKSSLNIASGTAPTTPNNGDIWFDGTDIKMRIGGVTKTFTLI